MSPRGQKDEQQTASKAYTESASVIATETFVAFRHPARVDDPEEAIKDANFELEIDGTPQKLDDWTISYLPDRQVTVLVPPKDKTITDIAEAS
jgi:hypothetical protein